MSAAVIDLDDRRPPAVTYTVSITQWHNGKIAIYVDGTADDPENRRRVAVAMREAADALFEDADERRRDEAPILRASHVESRIARNAKIVRMRAAGMTYPAIAAQVGLCKQRVRHICERAKLRAELEGKR